MVDPRGKTKILALGVLPPADFEASDSTDTKGIEHEDGLLGNAEDEGDVSGRNSCTFSVREVAFVSFPRERIADNIMINTHLKRRSNRYIILRPICSSPDSKQKKNIDSTTIYLSQKKMMRMNGVMNSILIFLQEGY